MLIEGNQYHTIWLDGEEIKIIDQRWLPHEFKIATLKTADDCAVAIRDMWVRGAPLIGITAAYGMYLAAKSASSENWGKVLSEKAEELLQTRPTAVNLRWALAEQQKIIDPESWENTVLQLRNNAERLKQLEVDSCEAIGTYGVSLIREIFKKKNGAPVNIMTHCNAGWLACIDWGTATAPIYKAKAEDIPVHVWVSETRPRNQGFSITAYELGQNEVSHTLLVDNAAGHLMQRGKVDLVITGADRVAANGDAANKIGTYLKALAAWDNDVPFYIAIPTSSIDWEVHNGLRDIPIEERDAKEVTHMMGFSKQEWRQILIAPENSKVVNYGFDVTPAKYIRGFITNGGIISANAEPLKQLNYLNI